MKFHTAWLLLLGVIFIAGCAGIAEEAVETNEVRLMTHDSFDVSEEVIAAFEAENEVSVVVLPSGDEIGRAHL